MMIDSAEFAPEQQDISPTSTSYKLAFLPVKQRTIASLSEFARTASNRSMHQRLSI